jgi:predicted hydrocarbon binding protein
MNKLPIAIPGNCFNHKSYIKADPALGLLSTRHGSRLMAVPEVLMRSIPNTLRAEAGEASYLALYTFGENWGKSFCDRILQDIYQYYREPIFDTIAAEFFVHIQEAWAVHGLGRLWIDFSLSKRGLLLVTIANSGISGTNEIASDATYRSFSLEAGFIAGWFSLLTNKTLRACAIGWKENPASIEFLVGAVPHIESIERTALQQGQLAQNMLDRL